MLDPDDFHLDPAPGGFARDLPARWCFGDRAFGGYTAALALGALLTAGDHPAAASVAVTFLEPGLAGPIEIQVEPLRSGRTAAVARATVTQGARPILLATAWLAEAWSEPPVHPARPPFAAAPLVGPDQGASLAWLTDHWPALAFAERRGVDYPTSWAGFARGRTAASLWARLIAPPDLPTDPLPFPQMADVLHLDGHLFDAPGQITGYDDADLLSLDLNVAWQPGSHRLPSTGWRLLETHGSMAERGVTSFASVRDTDGALLAMATSQGLLRR